MTVKVKIGFRAENLPCTNKYFDKHIWNKPLKVIKEYNSMIRVVDETGEEWSIFNGDYNKCINGESYVFL
ncbi:hypothetical protein [Pleomorphovibrio marinus]|uniref:hypothetical protein n=1 Tax=Pleomorphovibrio marinus TaxID=2164132 RepID=UPI000E0A8120|nr:hypothetical protein [Pleomorphovibrio marinus]